MGIGKIVFITYLNDDNIVKRGKFELVEEKENVIKFKTASNILTIPYSRILKIKEEI